MSRAMLGYTKEVLKKVSFDIKLFCKEIKKAVNRLLPHEVEDLRNFVFYLCKNKPQLEKGLHYISKSK